MKRTMFIISLLIIISIYAKILSDPLGGAYVYQTSTQHFIELSQKFEWLDSELYIIIREACFKHGTDIDTICAIIQVESGGNPNAINRRNRNGSVDYGLCQINSVHGVKNVLDIKVNINYGCKYLAYCMSKSDSIEQAIGKYNAGANFKGKNKKYVDKVKRWL